MEDFLGLYDASCWSCYKRRQPTIGQRSSGGAASPYTGDRALELEAEGQRTALDIFQQQQNQDSVGCLEYDQS